MATELRTLRTTDDLMGHVLEAWADRDRTVLVPLMVSVMIESSDPWIRSQSARLLAQLDPVAAQDEIPRAIENEPNERAQIIMQLALRWAAFFP